MIRKKGNQPADIRTCLHVYVAVQRTIRLYNSLGMFTIVVVKIQTNYRRWKVENAVHNEPTSIKM